MYNVATIAFALVATNSEKRVAPVVGFCSCSAFCCALLCVHSGFAIILMGREELIALVSLFSCASRVVLLFLAMPWVCLQCVIVVFPDHTHLLY